MTAVTGAARREKSYLEADERLKEMIQKILK
jgi:hypothetical protein